MKLFYLNIYNQLKKYSDSFRHGKLKVFQFFQLPLLHLRTWNNQTNIFLKINYTSNWQSTYNLISTRLAMIWAEWRREEMNWLDYSTFDFSFTGYIIGRQHRFLVVTTCYDIPVSLFLKNLQVKLKVPHILIYTNM